MRDDATLVELAVQGDSSAFAELYERYFDRVYDFLARMVRNEAEAADLAQDTFLRAMNSLGSLSKGASFKSWIFTIARNTALNRIERSSRLQSFSEKGRSDDDDEPSFDVVDADRFSDPEQAAEATALAAYVWEAAKGLDPNQYAVLDLTTRQGLDSAEIAEVLGVTKNNAYVMVNRMKKSLEDAIGALVLFKSGRDSCPELDAQLTRLELGDMSPEARRVIDRHASRCPVCSDRKKKMASPFAIFGGFAMVQPALDAKAAILEGLLQGYPYAGSAAGAAEIGEGTGEMAGAAGDGAAYGARPLPKSLRSSPFGSPLPEGEGILRLPDGPMADEDGGKRGALLKVAIGAAAVLLLGLVSFVAVGGQGGGGGEEETSQPLLAIVASASATTTSTPLVNATATAEATAEPAATEEPAAVPSTPIAAQAGPTEPGIAPNPPAAPPPTQAPQPAPPQAEEPPLVAPPEGPPAPPGEQPPPPIVDLPPVPPPPPCVPAIATSVEALTFGANVNTLTLGLAGNNCSTPAEYAASVDERWAGVSPAAGRVPSGGTSSLTVSISREAVGSGGASATLVIEGTWGTIQVPIRVLAVLSVRPTSTPPSFVTLPTRTPTPCSSVLCSQR